VSNKTTSSFLLLWQHTILCCWYGRNLIKLYRVPVDRRYVQQNVGVFQHVQQNGIDILCLGKSSLALCCAVGVGAVRQKSKYSSPDENKAQKSLGIIQHCIEQICRIYLKVYIKCNWVYTCTVYELNNNC